MTKLQAVACRTDCKKARDRKDEHGGDNISQPGCHPYFRPPPRRCNPDQSDNSGRRHDKEIESIDRRANEVRPNHQYRDRGDHHQEESSGER